MEFKRCYGCMRKLDSPGGVCAHCGYDNTADPAGQPNHALPCGTILNGRYVVGKVLGQGGFGITYIGYNLSLEMPVCIKEYFPSGAMRSSRENRSVYWSSGDAELLHRGRESFITEARKAVRLNDLDSIVKVWDVFYENETAYIIMNYLEGESLKQWLVRRNMPLDEKSCFELLEPVMRDLREVHERGIIHRDIKPDNLMRTPEGKLILLDLGAAKDLSGGSLQSSYMVASQGFSPMEQYTRHGEIGPWTDVYAMCATIYYCVTGKVLPTPMERMSGEEPVFDRLSPALRPVLRRGLAVRSADRIQDMGELLRSLRAAVTQEKPASAAAPSKPKPAPTPAPKKNRLPMLLAILLLAAGLAFGAWKLLGQQRPAITEAPVVTEAAIETAAPVETAAPTPVPTPLPTPTITPKPLETPKLLHPAPVPTPVPTASATPEQTPEPTAEALRIVDVSAGAYHTVALYSDGTVKATVLSGGETYYEQGQSKVSDWRDIIAIAAAGYRTVGLRSDGIVVAVGSNDYGQCNVSDWRDVIAIAADDQHTVGLRSDGTVVAVGSNDRGQCNVSGWRDITAVFVDSECTVGIRSDGSIVLAGTVWGGQDDISVLQNSLEIAAGYRFAFGLQPDGTIRALGSNYYGQLAASGWSNIASIRTSGNHTVGLHHDGTVVAVGRDDLGQCSVSDWNSIVAIAAGAYHTVGLRSDGTIVAAGRNIEGQCDVDTLNAPVLAARKAEASPTPVPTPAPAIEPTPVSAPEPLRIVDIAAGGSHMAVLYSDGSVAALGTNNSGESDVSGWKDIVAVSCAGSPVLGGGNPHTVGLRADGTVVAVGANLWGKCDVSDWNDVRKVWAGAYRTLGLRGDGSVLDTMGIVSSWTDIVDIKAANAHGGETHTVGLRSDGTVVAVGPNRYGECNVDDWTDIVSIATSGYTTVGIKKDGSVLAVGYINDRSALFDWTDITAVETGEIGSSNCTIGLKKDGTIVTSGELPNGFDFREWTDIVSINVAFGAASGYFPSSAIGLRSDGTVVKAGGSYGNMEGVEFWTDIKKIVLSSGNTYGLRFDGTIVATGENNFGQCDVDTLNAPVLAARRGT